MDRDACLFSLGLLEFYPKWLAIHFVGAVIDEDQTNRVEGPEALQAKTRQLFDLIWLRLLVDVRARELRVESTRHSMEKSFRSSSFLLIVSFEKCSLVEN